MTKSQRFILEWLNKEDWSSYGECQGTDLDALLAAGFVRLAHTPPTGYTGVAVTDDGRKALAGAQP